ncbi:hypothetical protein [Saccharopolyspora shandongensis]|uniref:hypothetical protein n=1 Tax=Saccharopolyspora shandongensis TaxID=418495 RepID=UPI00340FB599
MSRSGGGCARHAEFRIVERRRPERRGVRADGLSGAGLLMATCAATAGLAPVGIVSAAVHDP